MIIFKELKIERERWGDDKGQLKGKLDISTKHGELSLNLNEKLADKILQIAKAEMINAVENTANEFIYELTTAIPETLLIEEQESKT